MRFVFVCFAPCCARGNIPSNLNMCQHNKQMCISLCRDDGYVPLINSHFFKWFSISAIRINPAFNFIKDYFFDICHTYYVFDQCHLSFPPVKSVSYISILVSIPLCPDKGHHEIFQYNLLQAFRQIILSYIKQMQILHIKGVIKTNHKPSFFDINDSL